MAKIGRAPRLIAYDTDINIKRRAEGLKPVYRVIRTRTVLYAVLIAVVGGIMTYALATRRNDAISVIHDRNPLYVRLSDGAVRNGFAIRILNKTHDTQNYVLKVAGLDDAQIDVIGGEGRSGDGNPIIEVGPDQSREMRVLVTTRQKLDPDASLPLTFSVVPSGGGTPASAADHFLAP
jgi:polyferredoxin